MNIVTSEKELRNANEVVSVKEGKEIAKKLIEVLEKTPTGVGLAAPQIGIHKKVAVFKNHNGYVTLINPIVISKEQPFINYSEGCLSFPGKRIDTVRYNSVVIKDDLNGEVHYQNFAAVAVLHETEHLSGVLMFDNQRPKPYDECFCGSGNKFKFCCWQNLK